MRGKCLQFSGPPRAAKAALSDKSIFQRSVKAHFLREGALQDSKSCIAGPSMYVFVHIHHLLLLETWKNNELARNPHIQASDVSSSRSHVTLLEKAVDTSYTIIQS